MHWVIQARKWLTNKHNEFGPTSRMPSYSEGPIFQRSAILRLQQYSVHDMVPCSILNPTLSLILTLGIATFRNTGPTPFWDAGRLWQAFWTWLVNLNPQNLSFPKKLHPALLRRDELTTLDLKVTPLLDQLKNTEWLIDWLINSYVYNLNVSTSKFIRKATVDNSVRLHDFGEFVPQQRSHLSQTTTITLTVIIRTVHYHYLLTHRCQ